MQCEHAPYVMGKFGYRLQRYDSYRISSKYRFDQTETSYRAKLLHCQQKGGYLSLVFLSSCRDGGCRTRIPCQITYTFCIPLSFKCKLSLLYTEAQERSIERNNGKLGNRVRLHTKSLLKSLEKHLAEMQRDFLLAKVSYQRHSSQTGGA